MTAEFPEKVPLIATMAVTALVILFGCCLGALLWYDWRICVVAFLLISLPLGLAEVLGRPIRVAWMHRWARGFRVWQVDKLEPHPGYVSWTAPIGVLLTIGHLFVQTYARLA
ncbi:MAG: hypothetical protein AAGI09_10375 [Pseudomonadota bacterium]